MSRTTHSGDADTTCNITSQNYPTQKIPEKKNWNPKKILRSSSPLEVQSTPTPPRNTLSQSKFLTNWTAPALFLPTRTARIHSFVCLSCSWFVGNSIHCPIKLRFSLNMVCWSVLTVASFNQGRVVWSWVKITQDISAKFEFRYESLKSKFNLILFVYVQLDDWLL